MNQEHEILSKSQLLSRIKVYLAGSIATKMHYNEQFTNASTDIAQAKEIVRKVIYEYVMSENFIVTPQHEEELLRESVSAVTTLLKTLDKALSDVSAYLLTHENITQDECREILRKIF
jgi:ATP-dependent Zn protease